MEDGRVSLPRRLALRLWLLRATAARSRSVRPIGGRQAFVAGRRPLRVLLLGSGLAAGWGVGSHDLALPGGLARALAACTGRGAVVDVVPHTSAGFHRLHRMLRAAAPERYDAVVLSGSIADGARVAEPRRWREGLRTLLADARADGARTVMWLGAPPVRDARPAAPRYAQRAEEYVTRLNAVSRDVCRETGALFVLPSPPPRTYGGNGRATPADYLFWAREIVDVLAPVLQEHERPLAPRPTDGSERAAAIARLKLSRVGGDPRLDGIVVTAKRTLGTEIAMFTVLDETTEWPLAAVGAVLDEIPVEQSACIHTIQTADGMVVPNAVEDARFAGNALVSGPAGLRYYAGYPVEAPDGTRIGALCVFGRAPRAQAEGEADLDVLRELALLAQRELWRWAPDSGAAD